MSGHQRLCSIRVEYFIDLQFEIDRVALAFKPMNDSTELLGMDEFAVFHVLC